MCLDPAQPWAYEQHFPQPALESSPGINDTPNMVVFGFFQRPSPGTNDIPNTVGFGIFQRSSPGTNDIPNTAVFAFPPQHGLCQQRSRSAASGPRGFGVEWEQGHARVMEKVLLALGISECGRKPRLALFALAVPAQPRPFQEGTFST